jgi:hypothetical protein
MPQKAEAIARLRAATDAESRAIAEIDRLLEARMAETGSVRLQGNAPKGSSNARAGKRQLERLFGAIDELQRRREERAARRQVFEQILFHVDAKWTGTKLREFLEREALEMAATEATDPAARPGFWRFYASLSVALREVAEPREPPIDFIIGYVAFSSVLRPQPPSAYLDRRSYANGAQSMEARPMNREKAGDEADKRLRQLGLLQPGATPVPKPAQNRALILNFKPSPQDQNSSK